LVNRSPKICPPVNFNDPQNSKNLPAGTKTPSCDTGDRNIEAIFWLRYMSFRKNRSLPEHKKPNRMIYAVGVWVLGVGCWCGNLSDGDDGDDAIQEEPLLENQCI